MQSTQFALTLVVGGVLLWLAAEILFLFFAGVLFAVLLRTVGRGVQALTKMPLKASVLVAVLLLFLVIGGVGWLVAPPVAEQLDVLQETVPQAFDQVAAQLQQYGWGQELTRQAQDFSARDETGQALAQTFGVFSSVLGALASIAFVVALGVYLALDPDTYRSGLVRLFPVEKRKRIDTVLGITGMTLRRWLFGTLLAMLTIGVLTTIGLWALGVPLALTLGLLAGLLAFIPMVGPILSSVPAVLLALTVSPQLALYVVLLYLAVQFVENYLVTPLIHKRTVSLPPALTIAAQILMGFFFGFLGLLLATPMLAVALVLVKLLYIEDELGEQTHIAGRKKK
jgi:predicted PurR-regulated permease PerM